MLLNTDIKVLLENQINLELHSSYLYVKIANYFKYKNFDGFAKLFNDQAIEEYEHAQKIITYLNDNRVNINFTDIKVNNIDLGSCVDVFKNVIEHEILVSKSILNIKEKCEMLRDYSTSQFLNWFISEQVEEVNAMDTYMQTISTLESIGNIKLYDIHLLKELNK